MVIAINLRDLSVNKSSSVFLENCFIKIAALHSKHSFVFIAEKPLLFQSPVSINISLVVLPKQSKSQLLWRLWYNYKLPKLLKKINADMLVSAGAECSLRYKLPQILFINDLAFLQNPANSSARYLRLLNKNFVAFLTKSKFLFTSSVFIKNKIIENYKIDGDIISVLSPGTNKIYQPIPWGEKEKVKEKYSASKEYFLYSGPFYPTIDFINLLKAFSVFKKRQKTNMQLVFAANGEIKNQKFTGSLQSFKFRNEVILLQNVNKKELHKIVAAAYAFVDVENEGNDLFGLLNVMQCAVPLIVKETDERKEWLKEATLFTDTKSVEEIAGQMMLLFTNESKRNEHIIRGIQKAKEYHWEKTTSLLWQKIQEIAE